MSAYLTPLATVAVFVTAAFPAPAAASTTLDRTIRAKPGGLGLAIGAGERHRVRAAPGIVARAGREDRRRSLTYFAHLADLHIVDEASPARLDFLRAGGGPTIYHRPQEAMTAQVADQAVRAINANASSPVRAAGGARARMRFALVAGDLADNAQVNEVRWAVRALSGGRLSPHSGVRSTRCRTALARMDRDVNLRRYTGVQDPGGRAGSRHGGRRLVYEPALDRPRHPTLLDDAQRAFTAAGLNVPWVSMRGNHDALRQGSFGPRRTGGDRLATGCRKAFMPAGRVNRRNPWSALRTAVRRGRMVAPDPARRRIASPGEFRRLHGRTGRSRGFGYTSPAQRRRSRGSALYYSWSPSPGLRMVTLDTSAIGDGPGGQIDHPQYVWLRKVLRGARTRRERVLVSAHHPLEMMRNRIPDEASPRFDTDPRDSRPLHLGMTGRASLRALLLRHPNVVAYLAGHKHNNAITPHFRGGRGFWQVVTSSLISAPQQSRLVELTSNGDGTLSIFTSMVDHAAPIRPRPRVPGTPLDPADLASVSRSLSWRFRRGRPTSTARMRNTELMLRDPLATR